MVIGNPTRIEESAIHGEQNGKGGTGRGAGGRLAAGSKAKVPIGVLPPDLLVQSLKSV